MLRGGGRPPFRCKVKHHGHGFRLRTVQLLRHPSRPGRLIGTSTRIDGSVCVVNRFTGHTFLLDTKMIDDSVCVVYLFTGQTVQLAANREKEMVDYAACVVNLYTGQVFLLTANVCCQNDMKLSSHIYAKDCKVVLIGVEISFLITKGFRLDLRSRILLHVTFEHCKLNQNYLQPKQKNIINVIMNMHISFNSRSSIRDRWQFILHD